MHNNKRISPSFLFQIDTTEKAVVVAKCDHLTNLKFSKSRFYA